MSIKEKKNLEKILGKNISLSVVLYVVVFTVSLSWFADGLSGILPKDYDTLIMLGVSTVSIIGLFLRMKSLNKKYTNPDNVNIQKQKSTPKKVLVLTLSYLTTYLEMEEITNIGMTNIGKREKDSILGSWQMPLEAIHFHIETLEELVILVSNESNKQYVEFASLVNRLFSKQLKMSKVYADINSLPAINKAYHEVAKNISTYKNSQIVYDITSGSKLSTTAAILFALNSDRLIEYVDTNDYVIYMYDNSYVYDE